MDMAAPLSAKLEMTSRGPLVLLFFDGYDLSARPGPGGMVYSQSRRLARYLYRTARRKQVHTGFYTAFLSLQRSLRSLGCDVRVNDFAAARKRPHYPIGMAGYPTALEVVNLDNPVIFGHGDIGFPEQASKIAARDNMKILIQPCDWACAFNVPYCGDKLRAWPVGVDHTSWTLPDQPKLHDFLIYDKIRWHRDTQVPAVLDRVIQKLQADGHSYKVLRYGGHIRQEYRQAMAQSRALLFLCEHETQGIAYQEAMAAGLPVLAWDEGRLIDPALIHYAPDLQVTSVPYFDDRCGLRFTMANFADVLPQFVERLDSFTPREYVADRLSMRRAAEDYLGFYASLIH
ncbi:glycosyltransferase [uncultured Devosia sp.]|uniref:glycosyltransferase n=1 Tax=uncultured Devosia sp. TaxID=211434 RepID=UPI0035CA377E